MSIFIDEKKCVGCGLCVELCPQKALRVKHLKSEVDFNKCDSCGYCLNVCVCSAISKG